MPPIGSIAPAGRSLATLGQTDDATLGPAALSPPSEHNYFVYTGPRMDGIPNLVVPDNVFLEHGHIPVGGLDVEGSERSRADMDR